LKGCEDEWSLERMEGKLREAPNLATDDSAVHFFSVSNLYDHDDAVLGVNGINNSIVALANAVFFFGGEFF
jgi:hypothetical protein